MINSDLEKQTFSLKCTPYNIYAFLSKKFNLETNFYYHERIATIRSLFDNILNADVAWTRSRNITTWELVFDLDRQDYQDAYEKLLGEKYANGRYIWGNAQA